MTTVRNLCDSYLKKETTSFILYNSITLIIFKPKFILKFKNTH